jgi:hypothetical protein
LIIINHPSIQVLEEDFLSHLSLEIATILYMEKKKEESNFYREGKSAK